MKLISSFAALAFVSVGLGAVPALADTKIHAEYTADYDRVRPDPYKGIHLKHSFDVTLSGTNSVQESGARQAGSASDQQDARKILGQRSSDGGTAWTVAGPDKLVRTQDAPQSTLTMTIAVNDKACTLTVEFKLKPGFKEFMFKQIRNGKMGYFTEPKVGSTTCSIQ